MVSLISFAIASALGVASAAGVSDSVLSRTYERKMHAEDGRYLDLDTGELVQDLPPGDLLREFTEKDLRIRVGKDMIGLPVPAERWNATVEEVLTGLSKGALRDEVRFDARKSDTAWFFRTREGTSGVLKFVIREDKSDYVLVRFKRIRARRQFEPVVTAVLSAAAQRDLPLMDSETESVPGMGPQALAYHGVARLQRDTKESWVVIVENVHHYAVERDHGIQLWETMPAEGLGEPTDVAGASSECSEYPVRNNELPRLILLPQWGMLQIAEADLRDSSQPSVTIRYKRIAQATNELRAEQRMEIEQQLRGAKAAAARGIAFIRERLTTYGALVRAKLDVALFAAQLRGGGNSKSSAFVSCRDRRNRGLADSHRRHQISDAAYEEWVASVRRKYDFISPEDLK